MKTNKFKSNIKCEGCVSKVSPALNKLLGEGNWSVDLKDPARILTTSNQADEPAINQALEGLGYKVEKMSA